MIKNVKLAASFVGQGTARILADAGVRIVAVTDQYGGVSSMTGLDIGALERQAQDHRTVSGLPVRGPSTMTDFSLVTSTYLFRPRWRAR